MDRKRLICFFALIFLLPIFLNWVLRIPLCSVIGGTHSEEIWLSFWANYGGGIISFCAAIYVLYKDIEDRERERRENDLRKDLENKIIHCTEYIKSYQYNVLKHLFTKWYEILATPFECKQELYAIRDKHLSAWLSLNVLLQKNNSIDRCFYEQQEKNHKLLNVLFDQLDFFFSLDQFDSHNRLNATDNKSYPLIQEKYPQLAEVILNKDDLVESIFDKYRQITMDNVLEQVKNYINQLQNRINDGTTKNAEP